MNTPECMTRMTEIVPNGALRRSLLTSCEPGCGAMGNHAVPSGTSTDPREKSGYAIRIPQNCPLFQYSPIINDNVAILVPNKTFVFDICMTFTGLSGFFDAGLPYMAELAHQKMSASGCALLSQLALPGNSVSQELTLFSNSMTNQTAVNGSGESAAQVSKPKKTKRGAPFDVVKVGFAEVPIYKTWNRGEPMYQVPYYLPDRKKRQFRSFRDIEEARFCARSFATGKSDEQVILTKVTPSELAAVTLVVSSLLPFLATHNLHLDGAIKEYCDSKILAGKRDLGVVVQDYLSQPWVDKQHTQLDVVIKEFLDAKDEKGCRYETMKTLKSTMNAWARRVGKKTLVTVTAPEIKKEIHCSTRKSRSNKTYYANLHNFFGWARRNGFLRSDVPCAMDAVEAPVVDHTPPQVIKPETARKAIKFLADNTDPEHVLYLVANLFSGFRSDESTKSEWYMFDAGERIGVTAEIAKTHYARSMPILPNLDIWLKPFYGRSGFVFRRRSIQESVSIAFKKADLGWKHNWLRHSYASYRLALTGEITDTSAELGNSPAVLAKDYWKRVTKLQSTAYFELTPESCGITNWDQIVADYLKSTPECHKRRKNKKKSDQAQDENTIQE